MASAPSTLAVQKEEVLSLMSICCGEGEFTLNSPHSLTELETLSDFSEETGNSTPLISLTVKTVVPICDARAQTVEIHTTFELPKSYPEEAPLIQLSSVDLSTEILVTLQQKARMFAETLRPDPSMFPVLCWLQDSIAELPARSLSCVNCQGNQPQLMCSKAASRQPGNLQSDLTEHNVPGMHEPSIPEVRSTVGSSLRMNEDFTVCIARIDHMRNERRYVKVLNSLAQDLSVSGKILNCGRSHVYVILTSASVGSLGEFLRRWRTQNVDVDARGRPCKEKLISVLCRQQMDQSEALLPQIR